MGGLDSSEGVILVILEVPTRILGPLGSVLGPLGWVLGVFWRGLGSLLGAFLELLGGFGRRVLCLESIFEAIC